MAKAFTIPQEKEHYEKSFLSLFFFTEASSFREWKDVFSTRFSALLIRLLVPICISVKKKHERQLGFGSVYDSIKGLARDALGPLLNEIGVLQQL